MQTSTPTALNAIRQIVEEVIGQPVPDASANLIGLGANSMELVRIINRLEDKLAFRPTFDELGASPTLESIAAAYAARLRPGVEAPSPSPIGEHAAAAGVQASRRADAVAAARSDSDRLRIALQSGPAADCTRYASVRRFARNAVNTRAIAQFLATLRTPEAAAATRSARYGSAGGRYAVQVYLQTAPGGVEEVPAGLYYLHPERQELLQLAPDVAPDPSLFEPVVNGPIVREAAFVVYLVWRPAALQPVYGARARDYALLEAGAMAQVLREAAPGCGLGLCAMAEMDFSALRSWFELDDDQECLGVLVGGVPA